MRDERLQNKTVEAQVLIQLGIVSLDDEPRNAFSPWERLALAEPWIQQLIVEKRATQSRASEQGSDRPYLSNPTH